MCRQGLRCSGAVLAGALLIAACSESPTVPLDRPSFAISDGAHSGNEHFYFLRPMVREPGFSGSFDGSLSPRVEVCAWNGSECAVTLALFGMDAGYGSETIRVSPTDEHYVVNWHAEEILDRYPLAPGETYRVRVLLEGRELGFADIAVVRRGRGLRNVDTDEFVPLKDGRTLPIKFRIEEGALAAAAAPQPLMVSAGLTHSCAVARDGQAYCWGANHRGQLGTGTAGGTFDTPQLVTGGLTWRAVRASRVYTCGLTTGGRVYCWGSNTLGELGIGTTDFGTHPTPEPVVGGLTFESLASLGDRNSSSTCGVAAGGDMYCWGSNISGQLGTGTMTHDEPTPRLVTGGYAFAGPAGLGREFACGLSMSDELLCWGVNDFGQLGRGFTSSSTPQATPGPVLGGHPFESVAVGAMHACGIDVGGAAWCWGRNQDGELGLGTTGAPHTTPEAVAGGHVFAELSAGWSFGCGVSLAGEGLCWGHNQFAQLGRGFTSGPQSMPGPVAGGHAFELIEAGKQHACGVTPTGEVYCWGNGSSGQLGNGSTSSATAPVLAMDLDPSSAP